jgi:hypothetical protein
MDRIDWRGVAVIAGWIVLCFAVGLLVKWWRGV